MELPEKARELLDMIENYADLQDSNQVMIPHKDLAEKFSASEVELAERILLKEKILLSIRTKEMPSASLSGCLERREEIIKSPEHKSAEMDFYVHSEWTQDALMLYDLGKTQTAKFLEKEAILKIGDKNIELTPSKNEFALCRVMFQHEPNEWVDWSKVNEEINGSDDSSAKEKKAIRDTYARLNERIEKETGIKEFLVWKGNSIKRRL